MVAALAGRVALVAGATRGAGRGIARALGEAGATVYCTGRSVTGRPSPYGRPETIDETAAMITAAGGKAIAIRVDHTNEVEVKALFRRILRAHKRVDIVVDSVAGEDPLMGAYGFLWEADLHAADAIFRQCLTSRIITAKHRAQGIWKHWRCHRLWFINFNVLLDRMDESFTSVPSRDGLLGDLAQSNDRVLVVLGLDGHC